MIRVNLLKANILLESIVLLHSEASRSEEGTQYLCFQYYFLWILESLCSRRLYLNERSYKEGEAVHAFVSHHHE